MLVIIFNYLSILDKLKLTNIFLKFYLILLILILLTNLNILNIFELYIYFN